MSESLKFRPVNEIEEKIIFQSISELSPNLFEFIRKSKNLLYILMKDLNLKSIYPKIYIVPNYLVKEINLFELNSKISSIGLYFGYVKNGRFYVSLEGAEFLYKKGNLSDIKFIYVSKEGERSVLYGNNILKSMVVKISSNLRKGDFLLIFNECDEILALAQSKFDDTIINILEPKRIIALNLSDKGIYLREKQ